MPNEYPVKFLVCIWEFSLYPKIYCYDFYKNKIIEGSQVAGDAEAMIIIDPFVKTDLDDMTFERSGIWRSFYCKRFVQRI